MPLIVGAGICGLMAAGQLVERGASVMLLDKGRRVGGRLATRRIEAGCADHGAQFFTARAARFQQYVNRWLEQTLVFRWSTGWSDGSLVTGTVGDGHPRYAVRSGMNALPKHLAAEHTAQGVEILTSVRVASVAQMAASWVVTADDGRAWRSRSLILTPPAPQSRTLLDAGGVELAPHERRALGGHHLRTLPLCHAAGGRLRLAACARRRPASTRPNLMDRRQPAQRHLAGSDSADTAWLSRMERRPL